MPPKNRRYWTKRYSYFEKPTRSLWLDRWSAPAPPFKKKDVVRWATTTDVALQKSNLDRTHHLRVWAISEIYSQAQGGRRQQW